MAGFEALAVGDATPRMYVAGEAASGAPGVVVLHAWWGLNDDVIAYADRLAGAGFAVVAPDLYDGQVVGTVEEAKAAAGQADEATGDAIALAAIDWLAERLGSTAPIAALGFSFGAHWAIWTAGQRDQVRASVVYYGTTWEEPLKAATVPVLGHFGANDDYEPDEAIDEYESTLRSVGREVVIHRYPDAGHWFAEPSRDAFRPDAADLAFERTVAFLEEHLRASRS